MPAERPIVIATRGSALALAQARQVAVQCRAAFPRLQFELKIIKTTGDKLQTAALAGVGGSLPKGLFTKELEVALLKAQADLAVHSLKDLPTELPGGLILAATPPRADVRDVFIYRAADYFVPRANAKTGLISGRRAHNGLPPHATLKDFPAQAIIGTSSTRRKSALLAARQDLSIATIRGNVPTRLQKVAAGDEFDATILALAGLTRLNFTIQSDGKLTGDGVPDGLLAAILDLEIMLPCVGQGAIGIETRANDERIATICERLNHCDTFQCVTAERSFLHAMGGGCQSPVGAYAEIIGGQIRLRAISYREASVKRGEGKCPVAQAAELGRQIAAELK